MKQREGQRPGSVCKSALFTICFCILSFNLLLPSARHRRLRSLVCFNRIVIACGFMLIFIDNFPQMIYIILILIMSLRSTARMNAGRSIKFPVSSFKFPLTLLPLSNLPGQVHIVLCTSASGRV